MSATFDFVCVLDVTSDNFKDIWPCLVFAIHSSSFVALDLEMSGIGDRRKLSEKSVDIRYEYMRDVAQSRAIISMGLSCFKSVPVLSQAGDQEIAVDQYSVQNFNLTVLCSEEYIVEPQSLSFLVDHGFDFNKQYSKGISYSPKHCKDSHTDDSCSLKKLFSTIISSNKPIILHNGLIDIIFMYQSFYTELPKSLASFVADLSEMFSAGIYDTKYLAEFHLRESASFLEYIFKKNQHLSADCSKAGLPHVVVNFPSAFQKSPCAMIVNCSLPSDEDKEIMLQKKLCSTYASHGHCPKRKLCTWSHEVEVVLAHEERALTKKQRKRKRKRKTEELDVTESNGTKPTILEESEGTDNEELIHSSGISLTSQEAAALQKNQESLRSTDKPKPPRAKGHRAGFDAFMTGFCYAMAKIRLISKDTNVNIYSNKLSLGGKDIPLHIMKSQFAKTSENHKVLHEKRKSGCV